MKQEEIRALVDVPLAKRMRAVRRLIDDDQSLTPDDRWRLFCIGLVPQAFLHRQEAA